MICILHPYYIFAGHILNFMLGWLKNRPGFVLLFILAFLFLAGEGARIIQYPPRTTHIWRQSDCLAYTKTYYQRDLGLFSPTAYNLAGKGGRAALSEFPILYYISAKLCKFLGFHYWIIRGVTVICFILGLYYLFLSSRLWIKDTLLAVFSVVILASTPFYFYYAINYLPNIPAISFSFAGLYHMLCFRRSGSNRQLAIGTFFFVIAALLKPTDGGLIWLACTAVLFTEFVMTKSDRKKLIPLFISFTAVALCTYSWYLFVRHYNDLYFPNMNAQGIYPVWSMPREQAMHTFLSRFDEWYWKNFQHLSLHLLWFAFTIIYIIRWRKLDRFLRLFTLWLILGVLAYSALWLDAFLIHDYYELIYTIPVVFISITVIASFSGQFAQMNGKLQYATYALLLAFMTISTYHNQAIQLERYDDSGISVSNPAIFEVEPYLRKIGISEMDSVFSVPDTSPNISLAAFGNPGYTSDYYKGLFTVPFCREHGIKYMIIADQNYIDKPEYKPYTTKLIGEFKGISIYDISQPIGQ